MFKSLILSVVLGEGIVGVILTLFLLAGNQNMHSIANTLAFLGVMLLLAGAAPSANAGRSPAGPPMTRTVDIQSTTRRLRVFNSEGLGRVLCTFAASAIMIGTAVLFYFTPRAL